MSLVFLKASDQTNDDFIERIPELSNSKIIAFVSNDVKTLDKPYSIHRIVKTQSIFASICVELLKLPRLKAEHKDIVFITRPEQQFLPLIEHLHRQGYNVYFFAHQRIPESFMPFICNDQTQSVKEQNKASDEQILASIIPILGVIHSEICRAGQPFVSFGQLAPICRNLVDFNALKVKSFKQITEVLYRYDLIKLSPNNTEKLTLTIKGYCLLMSHLVDRQEREKYLETDYAWGPMILSILYLKQQKGMAKADDLDLMLSSFMGRTDFLKYVSRALASKFISYDHENECFNLSQ